MGSSTIRPRFGDDTYPIGRFILERGANLSATAAFSLTRCGVYALRARTDTSQLLSPISRGRCRYALRSFRRFGTASRIDAATEGPLCLGEVDGLSQFRTEFAADSPLDGDGFELQVPRQIGDALRHRR
jgi:hypothetical protein